MSRTRPPWPRTGLTNDLLDEASNDGRFLRTHILRPTWLADHMAAAGINASGTRLAHLIIHSEPRALICNGPLAAKTYVCPGAQSRHRRSGRVSR